MVHSKEHLPLLVGNFALLIYHTLFYEIIADNVTLRIWLDKLRVVIELTCPRDQVLGSYHHEFHLSHMYLSDCCYAHYMYVVNQSPPRQYHTWLYWFSIYRSWYRPKWNSSSSYMPLFTTLIFVHTDTIGNSESHSGILSIDDYWATGHLEPLVISSIYWSMGHG